MLRSRTKKVFYHRDTETPRKRASAEAMNIFLRRTERARTSSRLQTASSFSSISLCLCASVVNSFFAIVAPALAQDASPDPFADARDGGKVHTASGFVCPAIIGLFERDAVGEADPENGADFCAYSALDGVYGTIKLTPLDGPYNAQSSLAPGFIEQEGTGGKRIAEGTAMLAVKPGTTPLAIYTRTYETAKLEDLHYRVLFAGAQFKNWAVEATIEYADPRDAPVEDQFLRAVFASANNEIATP
jgi:hypothetical protein